MAKKEILEIFGKNIFDTPKPEQLIRQIIHISTNPGDIVLDSFLGSGTTAAVAHKMKRTWIGIEMGEQAYTHCSPRLKKVVDGEQGGVSKDLNWEGGGGFRFCALGSTIFDARGKISDTVRFDDLSRHIWFAETKSPLNAKSEGTVIGIQGDKAYALLFNGVLKDRSAQGGNVLLRSTLQLIRDDVAKLDPDFDGDLVIYAASTAFGSSTLNREGITFKQTPYDISAQG
jgi:adenine-specific DNA-methyltransferase